MHGHYNSWVILVSCPLPHDKCSVIQERTIELDLRGAFGRGEGESAYALDTFTFGSRSQ